MTLNDQKDSLEDSAKLVEIASHMESYLELLEPGRRLLWSGK